MKTLKAKFNTISFSGRSFSFLSVGPKFYAGGSDPINLEIARAFGTAGDGSFLAGGSVGYAAILADNIYLEPGISYLFVFDEFTGGLLNLNLGFSLLF